MACTATKQTENIKKKIRLVAHKEHFLSKRQGFEPWIFERLSSSCHANKFQLPYKPIAEYF